MLKQGGQTSSLGDEELLKSEHQQHNQMRLLER